MRPNMRVLGVYLLGVFLGALDTNVLGPVFPLLEKSFGVSLQWIAWTVTTYTVAYVSATVLAGALGDRYGHKRIFIYGIVAFGVASLLAASAHSLPIFLLARVVQGAGAGAVYPNAQAEGMRQFAPERKGMALGIFGAAFGIASILGPTLGGFVGQYWGWPVVFLINAPIAVIVYGIARSLPDSATSPRAVPDWMGGLAFSGLLASGLLWIMVSGPDRWGFFILAALLGGIFWRRQRRTPTPFLESAPLANGAGIALMIGAAIVGLDMSAAVFVPTLTQSVLKFSIFDSGLALLPAAFTGAVLAGLAGILVDRIGPRTVLIVGLVAGALGGLLLAWPGLTLGRFVLAMVVFGLGTAFTMGAPLNRIGVGLYHDDQSGQALALMAVFRSIGIAAGPIVLTVAEAFHGFSGMFGAVAVISVLGSALFLLVPDVRPSVARKVLARRG